MYKRYIEFSGVQDTHLSVFLTMSKLEMRLLRADKRHNLKKKKKESNNEVLKLKQRSLHTSSVFKSYRYDECAKLPDMIMEVAMLSA